MICPRCKNNLNKSYYQSGYIYGNNIEDHIPPCGESKGIFICFHYKINKEYFKYLTIWEWIGSDYNEFSIDANGILIDIIKDIEIFDFKEKIDNPERAYYLLNKYFENEIFK